MFRVIVFVSIAYSFRENGIQCSPVAARNTPTGFQILTRRVDKPSGIQSAPAADRHSQKIPYEILGNKTISGKRGGKFFGRLALVTGLGSGGLSTAATVNVNTIAKLPTGVAAVTFGPPGFFSAFYEPFPYFPYPYPFPTWFNPYQDQSQFQMGGNQITANGNKRPNDSEDIDDVDENIKTDTKTTKGDEDDAQQLRTEISSGAVTNTVPQMETTATTKGDSSRIQASVKKPTKEQDAVDYPNEDSDQPPLLRAGASGTKDNDKTTTVQQNQTSSNDNVNQNWSTPAYNTWSPTFDGYYNGNPQNVHHVEFTTENSFRDYPVHDHNTQNLNLPFDRPANFHPYNGYDQTYPNPNSFVNTFLPGERTPEYLNSLDLDHFPYPDDTHQSPNEFRPIN